MDRGLPRRATRPCLGPWLSRGELQSLAQHVLKEANELATVGLNAREPFDEQLGIGLRSRDPEVAPGFVEGLVEVELHHGLRPGRHAREEEKVVDEGPHPLGPIGEKYQMGHRPLLEVFAQIAREQLGEALHHAQRLLQLVGCDKAMRSSSRLDWSSLRCFSAIAAWAT